MPLDLGKRRGWLENAFWLLVLALAYIAMQKAMHPGWTFFGI